MSTNTSSRLSEGSDTGSIESSRHALLVQRIRDERAGLIRERKIKESKSHTVRTVGVEDQLLQRGWTWATLDEITDIGTGGTPPKANKEYYAGGTVPWITSAATNSDFIELPEQLITEQAIKDRNLKIYPKGSLVAGASDAPHGVGQLARQTGVCRSVFSLRKVNSACARQRIAGRINRKL